MIMYEMFILNLKIGVLWILWLSAGASAADVTDGITIDCGNEIGSDYIQFI